jgi:hypothetical protein
MSDKNQIQASTQSPIKTRTVPTEFRKFVLAIVSARGRRRFSQIAVDWLLRSDIGQVIKEIVNDEAYPDYQIPKKTTRRKKRRP